MYVCVEETAAVLIVVIVRLIAQEERWLFHIIGDEAPPTARSCIEVVCAMSYACVNLWKFRHQLLTEKKTVTLNFNFEKK